MVVEAIIADEEKLSISLCYKHGTSGRAPDGLAGTIPATSSRRDREISFPGGTPREAWRFSTFLVYPFDR